MSTQTKPLAVQSPFKPFVGGAYGDPPRMLASGTNPDPGLLGFLLKSARSARGLSQLELSLRLGISQRHLGFLEVGRSRPSRGMLLTILDELAPPRSVRNATLLAANFPPDTATSPMMDADFSNALSAILDLHDPSPALFFDPDWICRGINRSALRLCGLLMPEYGVSAGPDAPLDMIDATADPAGLLSKAIEPEVLAVKLLSQFWTEVWARPALGPRVRACADRLTARYGPLLDRPRDPGVPHLDMRFRTDEGELAFSAFQTVPGIPQDVNMASHRLELWYPRDIRSRGLLKRWDREADGRPS